MRIIQITEQDKTKLSEYGHEAVKAIQHFLECLDKTTEGAISEEMAEHYGERRGVPGTGRYARREGEHYMEHYPYYEERRMPYREEHYPPHYTERSRMPYREEHYPHEYGNRYVY